MKTKADTKAVLIILGKTEREIIRQFADKIGSKSKSAALRQIIRDWAANQKPSDK